jgi:hypothetical protein
MGAAGGVLGPADVGRSAPLAVGSLTNSETDPYEEKVLLE